MINSIPAKIVAKKAVVVLRAMQFFHGAAFSVSATYCQSIRTIDDDELDAAACVLIHVSQFPPGVVRIDGGKNCDDRHPCQPSSSELNLNFVHLVILRLTDPRHPAFPSPWHVVPLLDVMGHLALIYRQLGPMLRQTTDLL